MKSCSSRKGSRQEMGNYEFNWSGLSDPTCNSTIIS